jgi:hypothetical protein
VKKGRGRNIRMIKEEKIFKSYLWSITQRTNQYHKDDSDVQLQKYFKDVFTSTLRHETEGIVLGVRCSGGDKLYPTA